MSEAEENEGDTLITRLRSPVFSKAETITLLDLIEKYKSIIQNKSVTNAANRIKENTWAKISKEFNKHGFENMRSTDCLRMKWDNLKRTVKKTTYNFNTTDCIDNNDITTRVLSIMAHVEDNPYINIKLSEQDVNGHERNSEDDFELWEQNNDKDGNSDKDNEQKRRLRGRTFREGEVKVLLNLIEKHKSIILNKCTSGAVNQIKEQAWKEIWKEFNKQSFEYTRSLECLKTKWENLKKDAKKSAKNEQCAGNDDVIGHTATLMAQFTDDPNMTEKLIASEVNDKEDNVNGDNLTEEWGYDEDKESEDSDGKDESKRSGNRSSAFSPRECALLLDCVKREKKNIFLTSNTPGTQKMRGRAWIRITKSYNRLSPRKKSRKDLRDKFISMKKLSKGVNSFKNYFRDRNSKIDHEETVKIIKSELESENDDADEMDGDDRFLENKKGENPATFEDDPLSTVLSSDSGVGWINPSEDKLVTSLKQELLNYKMETAKLKRKRIEDLIQTDNARREAQEIETALRIRAARLEATAAALKLPPLHPALQFTTEEAPAQAYLDRYRMT